MIEMLVRPMCRLARKNKECICWRHIKEVAQIVEWGQNIEPMKIMTIARTSQSQWWMYWKAMGFAWVKTVESTLHEGSGWMVEIMEKNL